MKFIISRTSMSDPGVKGVKEESLTYLDFRNAPSLKEAKELIWGDGFFGSGENHREENGMVVRDLPGKETHVIEIENISDLIELVDSVTNDSHGIIIGKSDCKEAPYEIEIYDCYRE